MCKICTHQKIRCRRKSFTQQTETKFYNLDIIISVGYRVKSKRGTRFRI
ncbi:MAG: virulence RhuM family protein [Bacteroides sp.]|nr:virulence RhuM family protein [Bacteroides sp.]MCM1532000.1 virulence RhuM family protein [Ruminococcus flavefaciens]MCM1554065.1 virulence RhuM family protein [Bacteroides sp.]